MARTLLHRLTSPRSSSSVAAMYYRRKEHKLYVRFTKGAVYEYTNVPEVVYRRFRRSDSLGSFFAREIRGQYEYEKKVSA